MLTLKSLREDPQAVIDRLRVKNFDAKPIVDKVLELDARRRALQMESDALLAEQKKKAAEIGGLMKQGLKDAAEAAKAAVAALKQKSTDLLAQGEQVASELESQLVLLTWPDDPESVRYEVEIFRGLPENLDRNAALEDHLYDNQRIYSSKVLVDISQFPEGDAPLYWRVRPIDADWSGMGPFSSPRELRSTMKPIDRNAPYPNIYHPGNGSTLEYPVYSYAGNASAQEENRRSEAFSRRAFP